MTASTLCSVFAASSDGGAASWLAAYRRHDGLGAQIGGLTFAQ